MGVEFNPISPVSSALEGDFTSGWVGITGSIGGSENSHLSSLTKAWGGGFVGVLLVGYLIHLPKVPQVCPAREAQVEKDHFYYECLSCSPHYQILISPRNNPYCIHFTNVNPSFGFLIKRIPDEPPCCKPQVQFP